MIWNDMKWFEIWHKMIWNESKWHKIKWKDVKGYEQILTEPNICKRLFTRMIGVLVLMWQRQAHATMTSIWGHFWSAYDLAWPKSSNDHSDMSCSIILHRTCWRDNILLWLMSKDEINFFSFRYLPGGRCLSVICTTPWKGASVVFFVWQLIN